MSDLKSLVVPKTSPKIDRQNICPMLVRVFYTTNGRHHRISEYAFGMVPRNELQIYTWMDATLGELSHLVRNMTPGSDCKGTIFNIAIVYPKRSSRSFIIRDIGETCTGFKTRDDGRTLAEARFTNGDFLDIAITPANRVGGLGHWQAYKTL